VDLVVGRDGRQYKRVGLTVNITGSGIGVIVSDSSTGQLVVSGFREMPNGMPNPSLEAGMQVGDILEQINGKIPATPQEAGMLLKASKGATPFAVLRAV
jgi:membrane-associated protease RseP (regulator of RpoE activity)